MFLIEKHFYIGHVCECGIAKLVYALDNIAEQTYGLYLICAAGKRECTMKLEKKKKSGQRRCEKLIRSIVIRVEMLAHVCLKRKRNNKQHTVVFFPSYLAL